MVSVEWIEGGLLAVPGFRAHGEHVGIKTRGRDLAIIAADVPCAAAVMVTRNAFRAAPVEYSRRVARAGQLQAVVVNSGVANAATGVRGLRDAKRMAQVAGEVLGIPPSLVVVASTGTIGKYLPMAQVEEGIRRVAADLSSARGGEAAEAIMTTDTIPKEAALRFPLGGRTVTLAGIAKGSGMVAPNMATMLAFLATTANITAAGLRAALRASVEASFNMLNIDGDTSCSDLAVALANGAAGNPRVGATGQDFRTFREALTALCVELTKQMAQDGDGAGRLVEVQVAGAPSPSAARAMARTIAGSLRVKAAVYGGDPNWGRVLVAAGMAVPTGTSFGRAEVAMGTHDQLVPLVRGGMPVEYDHAYLRRLLRGPSMVIRVDLHQGRAEATSWGCDLTPRYLEINADYEQYVRSRA